MPGVRPLPALLLAAQSGVASMGPCTSVSKASLSFFNLLGFNEMHSRMRDHHPIIAEIILIACFNTAGLEDAVLSKPCLKSSASSSFWCSGRPRCSGVCTPARSLPLRARSRLSHRFPPAHLNSEPHPPMSVRAHFFAFGFISPDHRTNDVLLLPTIGQGHRTWSPKMGFFPPFSTSLP